MMAEKSEWVLVGDPLDKKGDPNFVGCLLRILGRKTRTEAEKYLAQFMQSSEVNDVSDRNQYENIRIKEVEGKDCWWNDSFMMSD